MKPGLASKVSVLTGAVMLLGSSPAAGSAPSVISISSSGKSVVARTGRPAAVRTSRFAGSRVSYVALGYDCHDVEGRRTLGLTLRGPYCTTVFLINRRTGKLTDFFSGSQRYRGPGGIRVGTPSAVAERALHQRLRRACGENLGLASRAAQLTIEFASGRERSDRSIVGAHLEDFALTSRRHDVGLYPYLC